MASERAERRLAAVLAADVVGYSRLMGSDEEGTLDALKILRKSLINPKIAEYRGRVVKNTGDGVLVEFASSVDAVRCAIDIQRAMRERNVAIPDQKKIEFRIGINVGDIIIDDDDIFGDGVNVAARLESISAAGGVCISDVVHQQVNGRVEAVFADLGEQALKNIARLVRAFSVALDNVASPASPAASAVLALPDKPSIAVLPFNNMSGDPEQDYFADGMVEDITTGLARIKWLFVIARNSSFTYKGKPIDVRQVGRELGVRYVLEGSVRKSGNRVRITAQLIEAETAAHLWADRYDGALADVFDLQDQITESVVGVVEPSLRQSEIERSRRKHPENLGAYDLYLRAQPHMTSVMPEDARVGAHFLEEALALDPNYAAAHAFLAWYHEQAYMRGGYDATEKHAGIQHARAAIASGTDDTTALAVAALAIAHLDKDYETALRTIERALSLNQSSATALYVGAHLNAFNANPATAILYANRALRLSPFDPLTYEGENALGVAAIQEARYDEAASHFGKAIQANPRFSTLYFFQAAALAQAGRLEEAKPVARRLLELEPGFRIRVTYELGTAISIADKIAAGGRLLALPE